MMTLQPDWEAIKAEYEGGTPLRALAAKYGVSKSAIAKHKYQEHWAEKKSGQVDKISDTGGRTRDINAATRVHMAIRIYLEEHPTWDEIARRTGFASRGACHSAVMREMERIVADDGVCDRLQVRFELGAQLRRIGLRWCIDASPVCAVFLGKLLAQLPEHL